MLTQFIVGGVSSRWRTWARTGRSGPAGGQRGGRVFLSTFEKQLDAKRRIVVPQEFRAAAAGPVRRRVLLPLASRPTASRAAARPCSTAIAALIEELPFGDPLRTRAGDLGAGRHGQLAFDTAGRITLPESLCEQFGLTDWVAVVGLGDRFQIWERDAFRAHRAAQRQVRPRRACRPARAAAGGALAGRGRMSDAAHTPVLLDEVLEALQPAPGS